MLGAAVMTTTGRCTAGAVDQAQRAAEQGTPLSQPLETGLQHPLDQRGMVGYTHGPLAVPGARSRNGDKRIVGGRKRKGAKKKGGGTTDRASTGSTPCPWSQRQRGIPRCELKPIPQTCSATPSLSANRLVRSFYEESMTQDAPTGRLRK